MSHHCPGCGREIKWALTFCARCVWRNRSRPNPPWGEVQSGLVHGRKKGAVDAVEPNEPFPDPNK